MTHRAEVDPNVWTQKWNEVFKARPDDVVKLVHDEFVVQHLGHWLVSSLMHKKEYQLAEYALQNLDPSKSWPDIRHLPAERTPQIDRLIVQYGIS